MTLKTAGTARPTGHDLLGVYLNDHLAGATAGMGLARRMAAAAGPGSESAATLGTLAAEIAADRAALVTIMTALGIRIRGYKVFGAWAGEKAGRRKINGHLLTRSPLSDLEEAEILRLGVEGKAAGWRTLRLLADRDSRLDAARLDELLARAARQSATLEARRVSVADRVLNDSGN
jgi:transglutaminase-like putative cysteine protease